MTENMSACGLCVLVVLITLVGCVDSSQGQDAVTEMYKIRMRHIAEMNYMKVLSIDHILDIGASDGYWTTFASSIFPSANFFLIEGNPYLHQTLLRMGWDFSISVVGAESDMGKPVTFVIDADGKDNSQASLDELAESTLTTIDEIVEKRAPRPFKLLRFNLRGQEFEALQGAKNTLKMAEFVILEVAMHQYHHNAPSFADLNNFLSLLGFRMYDILDLRYSQPRTDMDLLYQIPTLVQIDVIWAKLDSKVFNGSNFPAPPPPRYLLDDSHLQPQSTNNRQVFTVKGFPGGFPASKLTSEPLPLSQDLHSKTEAELTASSKRNFKTFKRKKRRN